MGNGKSINLFLPHGSTKGVMTCTMPNWTGKVYKIPRDRLVQAKILFFMKPCVSIMFGTDLTTNEPLFSVGQYELLYDNDWWSEALVAVSSDHILDKDGSVAFSERYLQNFIQSGDYDYNFVGSHDVEDRTLKESEQSTLTEFSNNILLIAGALGFIQGI